jgi:uncharacterized membrane protein
MVVSALPFPTKLLAEYVDEDRPERVAATIYGLNLLLTAMLLSLLWRYAVREGLIRTDIADDDVKVITRKLTPGLVGYVVMIMLGVFFRCWPCSASMSISKPSSGSEAQRPLVWSGSAPERGGVSPVRSGHNSPDLGDAPWR